VTAGKQYLLRFSILGTVNHGSAKVRLRQGVKPWGGITDYQPIKHDSTRRECELLFDVPTNQPASSIEWAFNERHGNFWLDNVTLQEATIAEIDPQIFRFEYNSTNQPRTLELQGEWLDILGKAHRNQFILPPRESIVLIRKDACLDK